VEAVATMAPAATAAEAITAFAAADTNRAPAIIARAEASAAAIAAFSSAGT
jgi:hypothetical protein